MGILARLTRDRRDPETSRVGYSTPLAGVSVTPDNVVTIPAAWACLTYISESVAQMPWRAMRPVPGGNAVAATHPVDYLIAVRPNPECSSFQLKETLIHWALRWGNGYAEIERDSLDRPTALWLLHPDRVRVCRRRESGALYYECTNDAGGSVELEPRNMFHLRGFGEGAVGVNVVHYAAESLGWARAASLFGAAFFGNGANFGGLISVKNRITDPGARRFEAELNQKHRGVRNSHRWTVTDRDVEVKPFAVENNKGQFIETQHFLINEICRWFRVPPHIVAELTQSTNNNIEHQGIEAVQRCLAPWVLRLELEANAKLFGQNRTGFFTKLNMKALLRGDFKSQAEGDRIYREMGVISADEIREKLDLNKLPEGAGGDKLTMQSMYTTLERIGDEPTEPPDDDDGGTPPTDFEDEDAAAAAAIAERVIALREPINA